MKLWSLTGWIGKTETIPYFKPEGLKQKRDGSLKGCKSKGVGHSGTISSALHSYSHPEAIFGCYWELSKPQDTPTEATAAPRVATSIGNLSPSGSWKPSCAPISVFPLPLLLGMNCFYIPTVFQICISAFLWQHLNRISKLAGKEG